MDGSVMPLDATMIAGLQTQTATGLSGLGCTTDGGLGTTTTMITTTSWTWGAAGVR
ncbi:hypothetical protein [Maricaulis sp.]|uniref:hypothetical protein n=1 Tax=Maricaulis sp. TaxID=1486257 RepID=UPI00260AAD10|nr:hypothetical protein [Maricaulis sp.]